MVTGKPLLDCTDIVTQLSDFVKHYFCFRRKWFLMHPGGMRSPHRGLSRFFAHWCKGLFCASLVPTFTVSASSARVALVALTVGLMALCICPGFPRWTSISSPNERMHEIEKVQTVRVAPCRCRYGTTPCPVCQHLFSSFFVHSLFVSLFAYLPRPKSHF